MQEVEAPGNGYKYHLNDEALLKEDACIRLAKRDALQFAPLYNKYHEAVFRFIYARMDDKDAAADLTSQVFLKALLKLNKYEYRGLPFSAWLFRIAINELNMFFRKAKAERCIIADTSSLQAVEEEIRNDGLDIHHEKMLESLGSLPEDELLLIEMRFFEKRPFKEIGEILSITENNAKVKTYRILDKLKKAILSKS
jgi:RNA polymerase sigma-70 factor (ECF subfamily)